MNKWTVEYDNEVTEGPEGDDMFSEWWVVSNGSRTFQAQTEAAADWLASVLNGETPHS